MSSSVFKEFSSNNNDKIDSNLVIVVNKDGSVSVDQSTLHDFLANKETTNTAVSIIRVTSPTPSITEEIEADENKNNLQSLLNESEEMMEMMANTNISVRKDEITPHVSLTVENFYPPEEARQFATELLNYAGVDNPLTIETYEYARFVVFNDHCYTSFKSPSQKYLPTSDISPIKSSKQINDLLVNKQKLGQTKPRFQKLSDSTDTKSESNDADNSDPQSFQDESDTESSDFSDFSENDRDSDLDFNINDRSSARIKKKRRRRRKNVSKILKKRQSTSSMLSAVDKEMENMFSEEPENKEDISPVILNRKFKLNKSPKKNKIINSNTSTPNPKMIKSYPKKLVKQTIPLIPQKPKIEILKSVQDTKVTEKLLTNSTEIASQELNDQIDHTIQQQTSGGKSVAHPGNITNAVTTVKIVATKKKTPAHVEALFSDMSSLFSTPDIIKKVGGIEQKVSQTNLQSQQQIQAQPQQQSSPPPLIITTSIPVRTLQQQQQPPTTTTTATDTTKTGFMVLSATASKIKQQLPSQISIHTHNSCAEYSAEQDKQLDLIDSIVKHDLEQKTTLPITQMNEDIPNIVKMLEIPAEHMNASLMNTTINVHPVVENRNQLNITHNNMLHQQQGNNVSNMDLNVSETTLLDSLNNPEDGLTADVLHDLAILAENENLQKIIDNTIIGAQQNHNQNQSMDSSSIISNSNLITTMQSLINHQPQQLHHQQQQSPQQQHQIIDVVNSPSTPTIQKINKLTGKEIPVITTPTTIRKEPIQIIRSDGRVITLPPIEAPTTRGAKRRAQTVPHNNDDYSSTSTITTTLTIPTALTTTPAIITQQQTQPQQQYINHTLITDPLEIIEQHKFNKKLPNADGSKDSKNNSRRSSTNSTSKTNSTFLNESEDMDSDDSLNSEDDPNRIWCLCKRPHNNRFMICCDSCLDWFHGKCVNISKTMGQQMEEQGIEWTCPNCITKKSRGSDNIQAITSFKDILKTTETTIKKILPQTPSVSIKQSTPLITTTSSIITLNNSSIMQEGNLLNCIVCKNPARQNSIYCSDDCIRKHAQNALVTNKTTTTINLSTNHNHQEPTSSSAKTIIDKDEKLQQTQTIALLKNRNDRVIVFERKTGRCLAGISAPTVGNLKQWLQDNPTFEVVQPGSAQAQAIKAKLQSNQQARTAAVRKSNEQMNAQGQHQKIQTQMKIGNQKQIILFNPQKTQLQQQQQPQQQQKNHQLQPNKIPVKIIKTSQPILKQTTITPVAISKTAIKSFPINKDVNKTPIKNNNRKQSLETRITIAPREPEPIRVNIRKTLKEQLTLRMLEVVSDVKLTEEEIETFSIATEIEMFNLFNKDTGTKYKAKYRSLMFNIKDRKNTTLFQKICDKTIEPKQLVRMSPEELASQELAQWRENENKHQLEMIKKSELDLLACAKNYVLKTHKGEEVIESKMTDRVELDPTIAVEDVVSILNNSTVSSTSDSFVSITPIKDRFDKFEKFTREIDLPALKLTISTKKKDSRRSRSRSKEKYDKTRNKSSSSSSSSKHKRKRSHDKRSRSHDKRSRSREIKEKRSRSRDEENSRSKSRDRARKSRSREKEIKRNIKKDDRHNKKDLRTKTIKEKESGHRKSIDLKINKKEIKILPKENFSLIDKILEASSSNHTTNDESITAKKEQQQQQIRLQQQHLEHLQQRHQELQQETIKYQQIPEQISKENSSENDQEPTSTVIIPTPPDNLFDSESNETDKNEVSPHSSSSLQKDIWTGTISMVDVGSFQISVQCVSGDCEAMKNDLPTVLDVVGRISRDTVWDYIMKIKKSPNKEINIIRLSSLNANDKMTYFSLYSYLDSRKRLGVIKTTSPYIKDFYILPLASKSPLPSVLLPIGKPGFIDDEQKPDLLIGIIIKIKGKRSAAPINSTTTSTTSSAVPPPTKIARKASTTPPLTTTKLPTSFTTPTFNAIHDDERPPNSPKDVKIKSGGKLTLGLPKHVQEVPTVISSSKDDDEPYSPGGSDDELNTIPSAAIQTTPASTSGVAGSIARVEKKEGVKDEIQLKMEELNRQIAAKNMEIAGMLTKNQESMDEPYSPSRPVSPPHSTMSTLANIAIPSNLQEILASINKSVSSERDDEPMKIPPPPTIGSISTSDADEEYIPTSIYTPSYATYKKAALAKATQPFTFESTSTNIPTMPVVVPSSGPSKLAQLSEAELMSMVPDDIVLDEPKSSLPVVKDKEKEKEDDIAEVQSQTDTPKVTKWDMFEPPPPGLEDEYEPS